jgi:aerobic carbon-monoxide dehydrogenase medium subunit
MVSSFFAPRTFEELWPLLEPGPTGGGMPIAGGTDVLFALEFGRFAPPSLVSLAHLPLPGVTRRPSEVRIGACVHLREIERAPGLRRDLPALVEACTDVGSVQLRHRATLGGNIIRGSSASDLLPPLLALGASLVLLSRAGRRTVPLEGFVRSSWTTGLAPGEILEEVLVPSPRPSAYRWQRVRPANDISQVGVAVAVDPSAEGPSAWRVVAGGTSPTVQRLPAAEAALSTPHPSSHDIERAAEAGAREATFATDLRAAEAYRRQVLAVLVRRAVGAVAGPTKR